MASNYAPRAYAHKVKGPRAGRHDVMAAEETESGSSVFVRVVECGERSLRIGQRYVGDVGCVVWDAALVLCRFLENPHYFSRGFWSGKRVVDLGSGTGVCGIAAAALGYMPRAQF